MAESTRRIPVPGHPGIYKKNNRYVVRYRHHGNLHSKSLRTLSEAKRFKGKADAGDAKPTTTQTFQAYAGEWLTSYTGRTAKGLSAVTRESYKDAIERLAVPYLPNPGILGKRPATAINDLVRCGESLPIRSAQVPAGAFTSITVSGHTKRLHHILCLDDRRA